MSRSRQAASSGDDAVGCCRPSRAPVSALQRESIRRRMSYSAVSYSAPGAFPMFTPCECLFLISCTTACRRAQFHAGIAHSAFLHLVHHQPIVVITHSLLATWWRRSRKKNKGYSCPCFEDRVGKYILPLAKISRHVYLDGMKTHRSFHLFASAYPIAKKILM